MRTQNCLHLRTDQERAETAGLPTSAPWCACPHPPGQRLRSTGGSADGGRPGTRGRAHRGPGSLGTRGPETSALLANGPCELRQPRRGVRLAFGSRFRPGSWGHLQRFVKRTVLAPTLQTHWTEFPKLGRRTLLAASRERSYHAAAQLGTVRSQSWIQSRSLIGSLVN